MLSLSSIGCVIMQCHSFKSRPPSGIEGEYVLVTVNGDSLPFRTFQAEQGEYEEVVQSVLRLTSDGQADLVTQLRMHLPQTTLPREDQIKGTYTHTATAVRIVLNEFPALILARAGDELTLHAENGIHVFKRKTGLTSR